MPTTRRRRRRLRKPPLSSTARAFLWDQPPPADYDQDEYRLLRYHADRYTKPLWNEYRDAVLAEWLDQRPGERPNLWWEYEAPRQHAVMQGRELPIQVSAPRKRLGGIGTPAFEVLAFKPYYRYGVPAIWLWASIIEYFQRKEEGRPMGQTIDPDNPPCYEAEGRYLIRHGLLFAGEERRLTDDNYVPESLSRRHFLYGLPVQLSHG